MRTKWSAVNRDKVIRFVQVEVEEHRNGTRRSFSSAEEIKRILFLVEGVGIIYEYLKDLPSLEKEYRWQEIKRECGRKVQAHLTPEQRSVMGQKNSELYGSVYSRSSLEQRVYLQEIRKKSYYKRMSPFVNYVEDEINKHKAGEIERMSTNRELGERFGVHADTIKNRLRVLLTPTDRTYRRKILSRESGSRAGKRTFELHGNLFAKLTLAQRAKGYERSIGRLTPEERSVMAKKAIKLHGNPARHFTKEQRQENGRKARAALLAHPNKIEGSLIAALIGVGLYAEDATNAPHGTVYFTESRPKNRRYILLEDGKRVIPDFKVKGCGIVIEVWGNYYHSQTFCEEHHMSDYKYVPERMIEEYAKRNYACLVFWESEVKNSQRLAEIVEEIHRTIIAIR